MTVCRILLNAAPSAALSATTSRRRVVAVVAGHFTPVAIAWRLHVGLRCHSAGSDACHATLQAGGAQVIAASHRCQCWSWLADASCGA